jgi:putative restriction endonuclease
LIGTIAVTDSGWWDFLQRRPDLTEVNFWRPSSRRRFAAPEFSPFLFKLRSPQSAICGFAYFARWSALPIWLAWETFEQANGCATREEMVARLEVIRRRIGYTGGEVAEYIGCTLLVGAVFFPREAWIRQPDDWKVRTQTDKKYDLGTGEGKRVWVACQAVARELNHAHRTVAGVGEPSPRYGDPILVAPRLGQRTFRIAVTEAYGRACAVTGEHSLPALDAGHIRPYADGGHHEVSNGVLLRADLHRLFDKGYVAFDEDYRLVVSGRLKKEFSNGRTYYPLHGAKMSLPQAVSEWPNPDVLAWHRDAKFAA